MMEFIFDTLHIATIELNQLTQKETENVFGSRTEQLRKKGLVDVVFFNAAGRDYTTDPTAEQLNAIAYIKENQQEIINSLYNYTKNVLYPEHMQFIDVDEISFPIIQGPHELYKTLGIRTIYVFPQNKEGIAYVMADFEFTGDFEHGVHIAFHKSRILGWDAAPNDEKINEDLAR
ncbi:DUF6985 domain-containing protein [Niastella populi]|uniref:DUF6985 domain-containing protein n=1 Tax=Niastella populi TaxID=550983 RepID=A0A1V9FK33_9BACT|nr:hypothetical protein [Niastella populi]OQP58743.1 hypothetical protein A4R26_22515 [Niastella populi]